MPFWILAGLLGPIAPVPPASAPASLAVQPPTAEEQLVRLVNGYRQAHGLPPVALSPALTRVAAAHAADMAARPDGGAGNDLGTDFAGARCTSHSWSAGGRWTPVCYTADHARAEGMWNKPREITGGQYDGDGYEIVFWHSAAATPGAALASWQLSAAHDSVIRETGGWRDAQWRAMGVGIVGHYAFLWFGKEADRPRR